VTDPSVDVAATNDLAPGQVIAIEAFGERLALWRTDAGVPRVVGRACIHLGANLARLGKVKGDLLVCSSHKWAYDGTGRCVTAPGEDVLPEQCLVVYPTAERNGRIIVTNQPEE
jgi:phenylpropionate dioxygenase-like ring-hydroxylating dioxygenase large terminal subunit